MNTTLHRNQYEQHKFKVLHNILEFILKDVTFFENTIVTLKTPALLQDISVKKEERLNIFF